MALSCLLALSASACRAQEAYADAAATQAQAPAGKAALPTLRKAVSANGGPFAESARAKPGEHLRYRITATMPEGVEGLQTLVYAVRDTPDAGIALKLGSVEAWVQAADGAKKATLEPAAAIAGKTATIRLGDLKKACGNLAFGDECIVEYDATVSPGAAAGKHPNVAWLRYDRGSGIEETEKAMAQVETPAPADAGSSRAALPATRDAGPLAPACAAALAGTAWAIARRRASAARKAHAWGHTS